MCNNYIILPNGHTGKKVLFQCAMCGRCCSNLSVLDRLHISWCLKTIMFSKRCNFLTEENKCSVYENRPPLCRKWECGVVYES